MRIKNDEGLIPLLLLLLILPIAFIILVVFFLKWLVIGILILIAIMVIIGITTGKIKMSQKRTFPVLIVAIVLIFVAIGGSFLFGTTLMIWAPSLVVDTETYNTHIGWGGTTWWEGNLELDDTRYITAMYDDYEGEKIVTTKSSLELIQYRKAGWALVDPRYYYYEIFYAETQNNWINVTDDSEILSSVNCRLGWEKAYWYSTIERDASTLHTIQHEPCTFRLSGYLVGGIKVALMVHWQEFNEFRGVTDWGTKLVSKDEAYLYSGIGLVDIRGVINADGTIVYGGTTAEEGGKVIIHVECGAGKWLGKIFKTRSGESSTIDTKSFDEGCNEDWEWTVPMGAFTPSTDPLENQYTVRLYNSVIEQSKDDFFTVDKREYIPPEPKIEMSSNYAIVGEDVIITMTGNANADTNIPIGAFNLWIWYGEEKPGTQFSDYWILDNGIIQDVNALDNNTYRATYTFKAHKEGTISAEAKAIDTEGRASDPVKMKIKAYDEDDDVPPLEKLGIDWIWIVIALLIVFGIIGYFLLKKRRRR